MASIQASAPAPVTVEQLREVMPHLPELKAEDYLPFLNAAMVEGDITTPKRVAAFLAQLAHESNELRQWSEAGDGHQYEGRAALGNNQPGDGTKFKGRGPIQLTGRDNYAAAGKALHVNLVGNPERAAWIDTGFRAAVWFWTSRGLNAKADAGDFAGITRSINGGLNGQEQRLAYYETAKAALGKVC